MEFQTGNGINLHRPDHKTKKAAPLRVPLHFLPSGKNYFTSVWQKRPMRSMPFSMFVMPVA